MDRVAPSGLRAASRDATEASAACPAKPTFAEVYEAHVRFVWRTIRRLGVPDLDVDDAVQDVFLVVHRKLGAFRPDAPVKHWIFRIAARVARDHRRSRARKDPARHGLAPISELETIADTRDPALADPVDRSSAARLIRELLLELDETKRQVFILAELEQMTAPEIAEIVQAPLNTVYSRLRAARKEFESALRRREDTRKSK
jgi:RNA polymerase sigma-70 factor (ECF subfamily)